MVHDGSDDGGGGIMLRRKLLQYAGLGSGAAVVSLLGGGAAAARDETVADIVAPATRGMPAPVIKDVSVIEVGPGAGLVIVKVTTNQAGLYGYGEATCGDRNKLVKAAVEQYLKPLVVGKTADRVGWIWQFLYLNSYYKNDTVQNAAISGICDALWDIKGRQAGMPVYQLLGGKARDAAEVYMHPDGSFAKGQNGKQPDILIANANKIAAQGVRNLVLSMFVPDAPTKSLAGKPAFDRDLEIRNLIPLFEALRKSVPADVRLGIDCHSLLSPTLAVQFCKEMEQFEPLIYVEDPVVPEEQGYLSVIRQQTSVPIAFGELYDNPHEWRPVIEGRLIDYIRCENSKIGGLTAALNVVALAENFEVKTSWHNASTSPVGHMANLTLDLVSNNFGVHEYFPYSDQLKQIFQGAREVRGGYAYANEKPGWGIEIDEALAARNPISDRGQGHVLEAPDGSSLPGP